MRAAGQTAVQAQVVMPSDLIGKANALYLQNPQSVPAMTTGAVTVSAPGQTSQWVRPAWPPCFLAEAVSAPLSVAVAAATGLRPDPTRRSTGLAVGGGRSGRRVTFVGLPSSGQIYSQPIQPTQQELDAAIAQKNAESEMTEQPAPVTIGKPQPIIAETILAIQGAVAVSNLAPEIEKGSTTLVVALSFVAVAVAIGIVAAKISKKK